MGSKFWENSPTYLGTYLASRALPVVPIVSVMHIFPFQTFALSISLHFLL